jgi:AcrR family transcriptional regulator
MSGEPGDAHSAQEPAGWQAQKSAATRTLILEAAIGCLVEFGYARTTTIAIADRAGLSRGAMLHHFPSKSQLVGAVVGFLQAKRLEALRKAGQRVRPPGGDLAHQVVEICWAQVRHPTFLAFLELAVAARTDQALATTPLPAEEAFEREWSRTARGLLAERLAVPERAERIDRAFDLGRSVTTGLAVRLLSHKEKPADQPLLAHLEQQLSAALGIPPA